MTEPPIGERVAKLEERTETLEEEITSLRFTRYEHANELQKLSLRAESNERAIMTMSTDVVPEIQETLRRQAQEIRETRDSELVTTTRSGVWLKILGTLLGAVLAISQGVIIYVLTK